MLACLLLVLGGCASGGGGGTASPAPTGEPSPTPSQTTSADAAPAPVPSRSAPPVAAPADPEVRAVWVHLFDDTLKTPQSIDALVEAVADANLNTIIAEVVRRQDAYYLGSEVLVRTPDPAVAEGFDVLAHLLEQAHAAGLEVQAWIPVMPTYHHTYDDLPRPEGWVWTEHGPDAPEGQRWVSRLADGSWADYLDPALPEVQAHVAATAAEIAERYPIDALHLDYIRYAEQDHGYHPRVLERFRQETGATGTPAPTDTAWSDWRRDQVDIMVKTIRQAVRDVAPNVPVTGAVVAAGEGPSQAGSFAATRPSARFMQDWVRWVEDGTLDAVMPMNYFDDDVNGHWFDSWAAFEAELASRTDTLVVGGQAGYLNRPEATLDQLRTLREGLDGIALYSFQQTAVDGPSDVLLDLLPQELWPERAPTP